MADDEQVGSQDKLDFIHASAAVVAESERLRESMFRVETELATTRQLMRVMQEDRHRVFGVVNEAVQLVRATAEDVGVIREVVERMDHLVKEAVEKLRTVKLPKFLQGML